MQTKITTRRLSIFNRAAVLMITLLALTSLMVSTVFAAETIASSPSRAATNGKSWTNISYSFASDNLYATARKSNKQLKLSNFNIPGIPGNSIINGIAVTVEGLTTGMQASVSLTYNGGSTYTATALPTALTASESVVTLGGATETWGRTWNAGEFTNSKFGVKLTTTGAPNLTSTISVDQVQVKVYYTPPQTTLVLDPVTGSYNGTAPMSATLKYTADSQVIPGKNISFYVGGTGLNADGSCSGTLVGSAATQDNGTATLASASLGTIGAGTYPYGACASFAGEPNLQGTSITNTLTVNGTGTTLVANPATGTYGETVSLSAKLTLTSNGSAISGAYINFYLFGVDLGGSTTNNQGVATLGNVKLTEFYNAGSSENIVAEFAGQANYNPASDTALITINPRPITVTAVTDTKVYDGTTSSAGIPTLTAGTLVTGDVMAFSQTFETKDAGPNKTITPTGAVDDGNSGLNYTVTAVSVNTGTITKATVNAKAADTSKAVKPVNAPDPTFTVQYTGLLGSDTAADIDVAPTCSVSGAHNFIGTYPITCSGGSDNNYDFTFTTNGTLSIVDAKLGPDTVGVFRPSNGVIYLKNNFTTGFADIALNYGLGGDYPVTGDWDGNGTDTIGVYRGNKFLLRNSNTVGFANITVEFGQVGDQPIAGDWDGDGIDTIGIYRPSKGLFLLRNSNTAGTPDVTFFLGNVGDVGIAGDWNGDGIDTTGVFRPSNGVIFLKNANTTGYADVALNYGLAGDKPVVGDWDNNGTTTIGVYRGNTFLLRNSNTVGFANITLSLGNTGDMPIAGNWDGLP